MADTIFPSGHSLNATFREAVGSSRIVLFTGLPGVGKSLLLKQLALMAQAKNREVHLLQWDVTRAAFETDDVLARYPEIDGVTHAAIRKAVGLWARQGVYDWHTRHPEQALLVGEAPLVGNRLVELVQRQDDEAETLLASEATLFLTPVPSRQVREKIEEARALTIREPQHEREAADAPPNVLQGLWLELRRTAVKLGFSLDEEADYEPEVYARVYEHLLRHRHSQTLLIDEVLNTKGSVYDFTAQSELAATPNEVERNLQRVANDYSEAELADTVARWYEV